MLAPFGTAVPQEEQDESGDERSNEEENGGSEAASPMSQAITPSSVGVSFLIPDTVNELDVLASWGDYIREEIPADRKEVAPTSDLSTPELFVDDELDTQEPEAGESNEKKRRPRMQWQRVAREPEAVAVQLRPELGLQSVGIPQSDDVKIEHITRRIGNYFTVSVFLVNRRARSNRSRPPVEEWIFQPEIRVFSRARTDIFLPRELEPALATTEPDQDSNRLLFRKRREFAIGHGCAADWSMAMEAETATEVRSELMPHYEIPRIDPPSLSDNVLDLGELARVKSGVEMRDRLRPLVIGYENWIEQQRSGISSLGPDLQSVANNHLADCEVALARIRVGCDLLASDIEVFRAFQFANRAMLLQRSHTKWSKQRRDDPDKAATQPTIDGEWRPFQIAFILLNLEGVANPMSKDRGLADLLWFPTGGGKTEAYLGLAAFTMALRRRRSIAGFRTDAGLSVLMRYTLRLLTTQQFQRASTLVCACEILRLQNPQLWGDYRFAIGLWVGMKGTPNDHDESRRSLARVQQDPQEEGANPCQLESCPWCGEAITPAHYWTDGEAVRTRVACPRRECDFSRTHNPTGIPVLVVDEEIYRECPSMLIATVDKFAQMPWNGDTQSLFGFVTRECERCGFLTEATDHPAEHRRRGSKTSAYSVRVTGRLAPPDLIIQDELHLISGPLGTLVGLYESAVDFLSSRIHDGTHLLPKVIASTATVRRAFDQVQSVFFRTVRVFPPPGLEPGNSYFAEEQIVTNAAPGRLYLGVCASGKSLKTAYVRVAASLLSSAAGLRSDSSSAEAYQTIVSYFNSLRELGGAIRLLDDDIPARLGQLAARQLPRRGRPVYVELTSRIRQEQIPIVLGRLERRHDTPRKDGDPLPLDVVLASNMISVGVDIDRLGVMTVTGQPKTTSEYIQATSRVGRQSWGPGLVVTIYNWSRPRDLSHYERFRHYHATLYRNVEAVSATPFSSRALDRGLRGTFVAMARLGSGQLSSETGASRFDPQDPRILGITKLLEARALKVADPLAASITAGMLRGLLDEWWGYRQSPLRYGWRSPDPSKLPTEDVLLRVPEGGYIGHWPTPQSLREVEDTSEVRILGLNV
jgi:hypothetical protein